MTSVLKIPAWSMQLHIIQIILNIISLCNNKSIEELYKYQPNYEQMLLISYLFLKIYIFYQYYYYGNNSNYNVLLFLLIITSELTIDIINDKMYYYKNQESIYFSINSILSISVIFNILNQISQGLYSNDKV